MTAIVGLMMLLAAESMVQILVIVLGISAILNAGFILAAVAPLSVDKAFKMECYIRAAVGIIVGLVCVVIPIRVAEFAWQTLVYVFAVYSLLSAIVEIPIALTLRKDGFPVKRYALEIAASLALSVVLFLLPSSFGFTIIRIGGAVLVGVGVSATLIAWKNRDIIADDAIVRDE